MKKNFYNTSHSVKIFTYTNIIISKKLKTRSTKKNKKLTTVNLDNFNSNSDEQQYFGI